MNSNCAEILEKQQKIAVPIKIHDPSKKNADQLKVSPENTVYKRVNCNICGKLMVTSSGSTSSMRKHLERCHDIYLSSAKRIQPKDFGSF